MESFLTVQTKTEFISRRHYLLYQATDEVAVRVGRFYPQFGILSPDHNRLSRRRMGFDHGQETLNFETSYLTHEWEAFLTIVANQYRQNLREQRSGLVGSAAKLWSTHKLGLSGYRLTDADEWRTALSLWGTLGLSERLFLRSELNIISLKPKSDQSSTQSWLTSQVLGYEVYKGIIPYLVGEWEQSEIGTTTHITQVAGLGLQWFPRPHIEAKLEYQKRRERQQPADWAYLLLHYYF